ncbi:MAG: YgiT-type zinc finger protein [Methanosarcinales archaeon Met12]|nr:MAG: YgiT-type zinc finger protein [Methanosarcinales archaeon Met12]
MKTCYSCGGKVEKKLVEVEIRGVSVREMPAEVCTQCGEKYFDTKTATFIQRITSYVSSKRREYLADVLQEASS